MTYPSRIAAFGGALALLVSGATVSAQSLRPGASTVALAAAIAAQSQTTHADQRVDPNLHPQHGIDTATAVLLGLGLVGVLGLAVGLGGSGHPNPRSPD